MRSNRFVSLNRPILSLEAHLGVTASPQAPFPTDFVTLPVSASHRRFGSLPLAAEKGHAPVPQHQTHRVLHSKHAQATSPPSGRATLAGRTIGVSRPREFHPESLAEPCVNLSIYTAPVIQPVLPDTASVRTVAGMPASSCATTPHCAVCAAAEFCTCAEPNAQASGRDTDRAHAWLSDRRRRSSSTSHVS
jgi:hypothetical protein